MPSFDNLAFYFTFPHVNSYTLFFSLIRATRSAHLIVYYIPPEKKPEYFQKIKKSLSCSLCNFIHPVIFFLPRTNISLNTPRPSTVSLNSSLNGRSQVQHPYDKTTNGKVKDIGPNSNENFPHFICS